DPLQLGLGALVEEGLDPGPHRFQRALQLGAEDDPRDPLGRLRLEPFVDRLQQLCLTSAEVVVEGAPGKAGGADDLLGADPVVAVFGEQPRGGGDQGAAGSGGPRRLAAPRLRALPARAPTPTPTLRSGNRITMYIHTVCML